MSGWENVPEEAPKQPRGPRKRRGARTTPVEADAALSDAALIEDGRLAQLIDQYFPHAWMMMLIAVSLIGIWAAIGRLPNHPNWWP